MSVHILKELTGADTSELLTSIFFLKSLNVLFQLSFNTHQQSHHLVGPFQSGYCSCHSNQTALVKIIVQSILVILHPHSSHPTVHTAFNKHCVLWNHLKIIILYCLYQFCTFLVNLLPFAYTQFISIKTRTVKIFPWCPTGITTGSPSFCHLPPPQ